MTAAKEQPKDEVKPTDGGADEAAAAAPAKRKFSLPKIELSRKTLLFVVAPAVLTVSIGVGAYFFLFSGDEAAHNEAAAHGTEGGHAPATAHHPVFLELPDILVNVSAEGDKQAFLKLAVSLELDGEEEAAKAAIEPVVPRVVDQLQTYLRELRVEDLSGSAAMFRLKEEMLRRVNLAIEPAKVKDVLFREMIVQ